MAPDLGMNMVFIFVMFAVLYFMMIRPQMKRQKELKAMLSALGKGDEVMVSGLVGKITDLDDNYVRLEVAKGVVVQVQRAAVSILLPKGTFKN
ncbi:preprotein translocase subunit YajC [Ferrovum sp. PN-J185]|nr:preprotein translocase subunit YajC [Ferrovum sp. PN-J185]KXW55214.1 preprotein translocase subunit YajC [Ferrovum sp. PN-J185]MCC6069341.1 preprotein translocase subunit YajC [Ferrovum sp. PN-J185]